MILNLYIKCSIIHHQRKKKKLALNLFLACFANLKLFFKPGTRKILLLDLFHMDLTGQFNFSWFLWLLIMFFIFSSCFTFRIDFNIKFFGFWRYFDNLNHDSSWLIITDHNWSWLIMIHLECTWSIVADHGNSLFRGWCMMVVIHYWIFLDDVWWSWFTTGYS